MQRKSLSYIYIYRVAAIYTKGKKTKLRYNSGIPMNRKEIF